MKKTKELYSNMMKKNTLKTTKFSGLKLKQKPATFAKALNTWLRCAQKFKTDKGMKTGSTNSPTFIKGKE